MAHNGDAAPLPTLIAPHGSFHDALLAISEAVGSSTDLTQVLDTVLEHTMREMNAQQGSVLLFDEVEDQLKMLASRGLPVEITSKGYIPRKGSIAEWVIDNNEPLILNDHPSSPAYQALDARRGLVSAMCVPLRVSGRVIGTINLNRTTPELDAFRGEHLELMLILSAQAAIFIENARLHEHNLKAERLAAIGQTVAGISHCIKNVLTGVRGGVSLVDMACRAENWEMLNDGHDILKRNIERLASIVLDMLDYSKDRQPLKDTVKLTDLADEVFSTCRIVAQQKEIALEQRLAAEALTVEADGQQLFRCILNLVQNALDATPDGGRVWIGSELRPLGPGPRKLRDRDAEQAIILRIGDSGPGIDETTRQHIFDPFFSTKGSKGTGLGLAVTRKIIEEHGGHIEIETPPGQPTVFAIHLPA